MTKERKSEIVDKITRTRQEIAFLDNQQIEIYEKLCKDIGCEDAGGEVWDYVYNNTKNLKNVITVINQELKKHE